ncbi:hypothetical protein FG379_001878 [Cryptosporidium bovis]|uniref:uncharacterized protein n=1 Tax=Cryptosporidium bovis TaxID=310047 RepID=UPI00351A3884|nr:hypothetical protein FG379_001878 [Cryptosporidium bovis]
MLTRPGSLIELNVQDIQDLKNRILNKAKYYKENSDTINHSNTLLSNNFSSGSVASNINNSNSDDNISLNLVRGDNSVVPTASQPANSNPSGDGIEHVDS